jgi:hypothetical protein
MGAKQKADEPQMNADLRGWGPQATSVNHPMSESHTYRDTSFNLCAFASLRENLSA